MPLLSVTVSVPPRVAPVVLLRRATVTVLLNVAAMLFEPSSAFTVKRNEAPTVTLLGGGVVTTSCVATTGGLTVTVLEVAVKEPALVLNAMVSISAVL